MHTASAIKAWRTCPRLYRYQYVERIRPVAVSTALSVGIMVHKGLEELTKGASIKDVLGEMDDAPLEDLVEHARAKAMVRAYAAHWGDISCQAEVLHVELEWEHEGVSGKIDALVRDAQNGHLVILEHKTTSLDISSPAEPYWQRLDIDLQLTVYQQAISQIYGERVELLYDVLRKPAGKPIMTTRSRQKKDETDAMWARRKASITETTDQFEQRLYAKMLEEPEQYLVRRSVTRLQAENAALLEELGETLDVLDNYKGVYPRNCNACTSKFGTCAYLGVCTGIETLDDPKFEQLETSHPELSGAA